MATDPLFNGRLHPMPGGIEPPAAKHLTRDVPIRTAPLPAELVLALGQHKGAPARAIVRPGQRVRGGETIARSEGLFSVALHAPTSGKIRGIEPRPVARPNAAVEPCILLEADGADTSVDPEPIADWRSRSRHVLHNAIAAAGIAGLGGAGFATAVKATPRTAAGLDYLVVNGTECEPYLTADDRLMRERAGGICDGVAILAHLIRARCCLIAIEDDKPEALAAIRQAVDALDANAAIHVVPIPRRYPSGSERQLITLLTGRQVPTGHLPAEVGVLCQNVATAWAVHRAIDHGEALISRVTTVSGRALARPANLEVRLGTPVGSLLADCDLDPAALDRLLIGGPLSGFPLADPEAGLTKTTTGILAVTAAELPRPGAEQPCIRCGACAEICPATLLPQELLRFARTGDLQGARDHHLADCIECGACDWVCPSEIPLLEVYRGAKASLRRQAIERQRADRARLRFERRQQRLADAARERDARRQARLQGASAAVARARRLRAGSDDATS